MPFPQAAAQLKTLFRHASAAPVPAALDSRGNGRLLHRPRQERAGARLFRGATSARALAKQTYEDEDQDERQDLADELMAYIGAPALAGLTLLSAIS
jgi:hypothetical protein